MQDINSLPSLKEIVGALVFGANRPLKVRELRDCIVEVAESDADLAVYSEVDDKKIREALQELDKDLVANYVGFRVNETVGGYRIRSNAQCGRWLKHLLKAKPARLSQPALETLAVIAYRQPISKADIEAVRGVSVSHVIKPLMEMHLVKIAGRSELPGRPFLYGTTQTFLEHFGLKNLKELDKMAPRILSRKELKDADAVRESARKKPDPREPELALEPGVPQKEKRKADKKPAPDVVTTVPPKKKNADEPKPPVTAEQKTSDSTTEESPNHE